jgi:nucleotide-binding universal stress UspA family protein
MASSVALGVRPVRVEANPVRRGPVVLATDGTSPSGAPVVAAQLLAARLDVPIEIVTVVEPAPTFSPGPDVVIAFDPGIEETRRDEQETMVSDYVGRFAGGAAPPRIHVRSGHVATEIARFARETSATIVVMGSAPHRRFRHTISGQRAAQVLHSAPCPVLSVPPTFTALPRSVVVAVDFGPSSVRAAQVALLVVADGGTMLLTHIVPPPVRLASLNMVSEDDLAMDTRALFDHFRETIGSAVPDGVKVENRLIDGDTVDAILSSAEYVNAEMIAVGTHGPGAIARFFVGSVAEAVLHGADVAVLASPPPRAVEALELGRRVTGVAKSEHDAEWATVLDAFSRRNVGRAVLLEVEDPTTGARVTGHGYTLLGATYEPVAKCVEIMVGDPEQPRHHLTRSIRHPDSITVMAAETGGGEVLDIRHGRGHTIAVMSEVRLPSA